MKPYIAAAAVVALSSTLPQANAAMLVHQVATGIYRGPAPQTEADYQRLKQLGVRTVLNLRRIHRREIAYEGRRLAAMGIAHLAQVPVWMLSTGQRKRAALARVVASGAPLWLLDEPANGLDTEGQERLAEAMAAHRASGGAILAATHQPLGLDDAAMVALA